MHALERLQQVDENGAHVQAHVAAIHQTGGCLPRQELVRSHVVAPGPELLHELRGVPTAALDRLHQPAVRKPARTLAELARHRGVHPVLERLDADGGRDDVPAPLVHEVLVLGVRLVHRPEVAVNQVEPVVRTQRPLRLFHLAQVPDPHRSPALTGSSQRTRQPCLVERARPEVTDNGLGRLVRRHVLAEQRVVTGNARHVLAGRDVGRNPHDARHVLLRELPLHPALGDTDQLLHVARATEPVADVDQVVGVPANRGLAGTHQRPTARDHVRSLRRIGRFLTRIGVVPHAPTHPVPSLDRVAGHVVGVLEPLRVRLHHDVLDLLSRHAPRDPAGPLLRRRHQTAADLIAQQGPDRLFPTSHQLPGLAHEIRVLQALQLPAHEVQELLAVEHEPVAACIRSLVARQVHPPHLVELPLGFDEPVQPELPLHRPQRRIVPDQLLAGQVLEPHPCPALLDVRQAERSVRPVHRPPRGVLLQAQLEPDHLVVQPPHRLQHRLASLKARHLGKDCGVLGGLEPVAVQAPLLP